MNAPENNANPPPIPAPQPKHSAGSVLSAIAVAVVVWLLVVATATLVTFILPERFASTALIKVLRTQPASSTSEPNSVADPTLEFLETECAVIQSQVVLGKVVSDLDLNKEWGKRYFADGTNLKTTETVALLKARLDARPVNNTSLIKIRVFSERPEEAARVANAVARAYVVHTTEPAAQSGKAVAEIIDPAVASIRPARPNKPLNIALGMVIGAALGALAGGLVFVLQRRLGRRKAI